MSLVSWLRVSCNIFQCLVSCLRWIDCLYEGFFSFSSTPLLLSSPKQLQSKYLPTAFLTVNVKNFPLHHVSSHSIGGVRAGDLLFSKAHQRILFGCWILSSIFRSPSPFSHSTTRSPIERATSSTKDNRQCLKDSTACDRAKRVST